MQELRQKVEESKSQHTEMLKRAQDICIEADDRANMMEKRADKAEARAGKAEAELVDLRSDLKKASNDLKVHLHGLAYTTHIHAMRICNSCDLCSKLEQL